MGSFNPQRMVEWAAACVAAGIRTPVAGRVCNQPATEAEVAHFKQWLDTTGRKLGKSAEHPGPTLYAGNRFQTQGCAERTPIRTATRACLPPRLPRHGAPRGSPRRHARAQKAKKSASASPSRTLRRFKWVRMPTGAPGYVSMGELGDRFTGGGNGSAALTAAAMHHLQ